METFVYELLMFTIINLCNTFDVSFFLNLIKKGTKLKRKTRLGHAFE